MCKGDKHRGVVFHLENFEILLNKGVQNCRDFLDDIRDILQMHDAYFIIVAKTGFFQKVISPLPRVRSVFNSVPIILESFSEEETIEILNLRYEVLTHPDRNRNYIKPVEDDLLRTLHELHQGRIRGVMNDVKAIILDLMNPNRVGTLTVSQAMDSLKALAEEKLNPLTKGEKEFFLNLPKGAFSNKDLVEKTGKSKQQVNKILRKLKDHHFVRPAEDSEDEHHFEVASEFRILKSE